MEPLWHRGVLFFWDHHCQKWADDKLLSRNSFEVATTTNNNLTASIPVFMGSDFWVWEQKMGDYLESQHLWRITTSAPGSMRPVEAITGAPTLAEVQL